MAGIPGKVNYPFPCNGCGRCCQHVSVAPQTRYLDRGDGTCRHFNEAHAHCTIYDRRPDICRIDVQYRLHFAAKVNWDDFVERNLQVCHALQRKAAEPQA
ncbi:YkgJ family cysteine cluster protein [Achromobacter dolens]|uniref:YkgJ family cysteine cluster protein n=1 Tax=Achromobacter TaxID=222 RepID=UPI0030B83B0E